MSDWFPYNLDNFNVDFCTLSYQTSSISGGAEEEYVRMLMDSPLFRQINDIQEIMEENLAKQSAKPDHIVGKYTLIELFFSFVKLFTL